MLLLLVSALLLGTARGVCVSELQALVERVASSSVQQQQARWAVHVTQLDGSSWKQLVCLGCEKLSVPASNNKLLSTAAAFVQLGEAFRFRTRVWVDEEQRSLCVRPEGDPSPSPGTFEEWAQKLAAYKGYSVEVDASFYAERFPETWEYEDLTESYGALPVAPVLRSRDELSVNRGNSVLLSVDAAGTVTYALPSDKAVVPVRWSPGSGLSYGYALGDSELLISGTGTVVAAVRYPELRYAAALAAALGSKQYSVESGCKTAVATPIDFFSLPLAQLMNHTLQYSDNLYAELWLRQLAPPTYAGAISRAREILTGPRLNVPGDAFFQGDGSGVSRRNLVAPKALTQLLQSLYNSTLYRSFLPLAGRSGSLANRYRGTPAEGHLYAKTGTLTGVNALSGYVLMPGARPVVFSIIVDHSLLHASEVRAKMDEIGVALAQLDDKC